MAKKPNVPEVIDKKPEVDKKRQLTRVQKNFLKAYSKTRGNITQSSKAVGISRKTYYRWLEDNEDFTREVADREAELNDEIRDALVGLAKEDNLGAIIFYLKNRHPDFIQNRTFGVRVNNKDIKVEFIEYDSK